MWVTYYTLIHDSLDHYSAMKGKRATQLAVYITQAFQCSTKGKPFCPFPVYLTQAEK